MSVEWPAVAYDAWRASCDTLHAHTQVLGKLAVTLAPPEPQLQHAALQLTGRGWETLALPAPDGRGGLRRPTARARSRSRWTCARTRPPSSTPTAEAHGWRSPRTGRSARSRAT